MFEGNYEKFYTVLDCMRAGDRKKLMWFLSTMFV